MHRPIGSDHGIDVSLGRVPTPPSPASASSCSTSTTGPGVEATANLLTDLCEGLADTYDVEVVTGVLHEHEHEPRSFAAQRGRDPAGAIDRIRPHGARWRGRRTTSPTWGSRSATGSSSRRPDIVLCMTDPPMVGAVGLAVARRFGVPLVVVCQDVFPETAVKLGRLTNPLAVGILRGIVGLVSAAGGPRCLDRRDDEPAARGQGRSCRADRRDSQLGRPRRDHAATARERLGARATTSSAASSSCIRATSATRRTSRRSSAPPCCCRTSTGSRSSSSASAPVTRRSLQLAQGSRRHERALPAVPAARGAVGVAVGGRRPLPRARARPRRLRRPEPHQRRSLRRTPRHRRRGCRERAGPARRDRGLRGRRATGRCPLPSRRRFGVRTTATSSWKRSVTPDVRWIERNRSRDAAIARYRDLLEALLAVGGRAAG